MFDWPFSYEQFITAADYIGIAVFAITGVLAAAGRGIDFFGVIVLGMVTALGGGTIRDVTLGAYPLVWVENPIYLQIAVSTSVFAFIWSRYLHSQRRALLVLDAFGLALFSVIGLQKALSLDAAPIVAVTMAVVTGVAGGMIRDLLTDQIPLVLRADSQFYATCAIFASAVYLSLEWYLGYANRWVALAAMAAAFAMRILSVWRQVTLPHFVQRQRN